MEALSSQHWHLAWIIPALLVMAYLGSPRHSGRLAHRRVRRLLAQSLDPRRFAQFHALVLPTGGGAEELDHVIVSRHGVYVVVSEHRPGRLRGGESQEYWKQDRLGRRRRWPNPLYRAKLQMETLQRLLEFPRNRFRLIVAIEGQDKPPRELPSQVMRVEELVPYLQSQSGQLLSPEQANMAVKRISEARLAPHATTRKTAIAQAVLGLSVAAGVYFVYGDDLRALFEDFDGRVEQLANPHRFDESGQRKSEQELFEESLMCAFSADTMRCACYEREGEKVEIEFDKCRELAERGSILQQ